MALEQQPILISWPPNLLRSVSSSLTAHVLAVFHTQIFELLDIWSGAKRILLGFSGRGAIAAAFVALYLQCAESLTLAVPIGWMKSSDFPWYVRAMMNEGGCGLHWLRRRSVLGFVIREVDSFTVLPFKLQFKRTS
jgi:hypothetical protein